MRRCFLSFILSLLFFVSSGQGSTVYLRGDTISAEKSGGNAELRIKNATRSRTGAYMVNLGNGVTAFKYAIDSAWKSGDSLYLRRGDGNIVVLTGGTKPDTSIYNFDGKIPDTVPLRTFDVNEKHLLFKKAGWVQFQYPDNGYLNQPSDFFSGSNAEITRYEYEDESPVGRHLLGDMFVSGQYSQLLAQGNSDTGVIFTNTIQVNEPGIHLKTALSTALPKGLHVEGFGQIRIDTLSAPPSGAIKNVVWDTVEHKLYATVSSGGGGTDSVTSVFGRTGAVAAQSGDYSAFYPLMSGSYSNPSWITSLAWSKITGTPTTKAGYGITDVVGYPDTAAMLAGYQKACQIITLTDGATITWNYSTSCEAQVTIAAVGRVLSITGLPTDRVSYGTLTVTQDATGGRSIFPPAAYTNRGGNNMNLIGDQPLSISTTGGSVTEVVFRYVPSISTIYWTTLGNYN